MTGMAQVGDTTSDDAGRSRLWRNRDFQLLMLGNTLNGIGSRMSGLAFPLLALWLTGSAPLAGLVGGAVIAGMVAAGIPAGIISKTAFSPCRKVSVSPLSSMTGAFAPTVYS